MAADAASAPALSAAASAALGQLADVALPPPVPWWPQTWGWAVLALLLLALIAWLAVRHHRRRAANRYRREALAELAAIEARLADGGTRTAALAALPPLLKRTALAAWPRADVASLAGARWIDFLRAHGGGAELLPAMTTLLADAEYRAPQAVATWSSDEARAAAAAARRWIEKHRVSA